MARLAPDSRVAAKVFPSPNHGERAGGRAPDSIILHYTGMASGAEALQWLCNPVSQVSCHYFVWEDGSVLQLVPEPRRAWHAGVAVWAGETDMNSASIGVEIVNPGHDAGAPPFPAPQIAAVIALCRDIAARCAIPAARILAHSDIAPMRKRDPGEAFPWAVLHAAGVGHYAPPAALGGGRFFSRGDAGPPVAALQQMLALYGYGLPVTSSFDELT